MEATYNYGLIDEERILLFNETEHNANPLTTDFLLNVHIKIDDNSGVLTINAERIIFDYYGPDYDYRIFEENWKHTPHNKEIHEGKKWWKSLFNIGEPERFVYQGFVRTNETEPIRYIRNKYNIIIDE